MIIKLLYTFLFLAVFTSMYGKSFTKSNVDSCNLQTLSQSEITDSVKCMNNVHRNETDSVDIKRSNNQFHNSTAFSFDTKGSNIKINFRKLITEQDVLKSIGHQSKRSIKKNFKEIVRKIKLGEGPVVFVDGIQLSDDEVKEVKKIVSIIFIEKPVSKSSNGGWLNNGLVFITTKQ